MAHVSRETIEALLPAAADVELLQAYHDALAVEGIELGLLGPREADRIWDRHIGNSLWPVLPAPQVVPIGATVADVGSGAGLPGLAWAIARPDLGVTLIEPLLRRAEFLRRTVERLGLAGRVAVLRARAESVRGEQWDVVTARAVAPMDRLVRWTFPLVAPGGRLIALKGATAPQELDAARSVLRQLGAGAATVAECGAEYGATPTRVVIVPRPPAAKG